MCRQDELYGSIRPEAADARHRTGHYVGHIRRCLPHQVSLGQEYRIFNVFKWLQFIVHIHHELDLTALPNISASEWGMVIEQRSCNFGKLYGMEGFGWLLSTFHHDVLRLVGYRDDLCHRQGTGKLPQEGIQVAVEVHLDANAAVSILVGYCEHHQSSISCSYDCSVLFATEPNSLAWHWTPLLLPWSLPGTPVEKSNCALPGCVHALSLGCLLSAHAFLHYWRRLVR
mmetsp:Transcript_31623/g.57529  ORF Transcript_31623/g.57529 Transcript_31623/m.57529 type:complete len:228 (-) Transcript_31623:524-1207(-)